MGPVNVSHSLAAADITNSDTVILFDTTTFPGARQMQAAHLKRFAMDVDHSHAGTVKAYKSDDRGANWTQVYDSGSIAAPAAGATTIVDIWFEPYDDFKVEWVNGGTTQTGWELSMALTDERGPIV